MDLFHHGIIPDSVMESIAKADGPRHQNSILYDCLLRACTNGLCIHNPQIMSMSHTTPLAILLAVCLSVGKGQLTD